MSHILKNSRGRLCVPFAGVGYALLLCLFYIRLAGDVRTHCCDGVRGKGGKVRLQILYPEGRGSLIESARQWAYKEESCVDPTHGRSGGGRNTKTTQYKTKSMFVSVETIISCCERKIRESRAQHGVPAEGGGGQAGRTFEEEAMKTASRPLNQGIV